MEFGVAEQMQRELFFVTFFTRGEESEVKQKNKDIKVLDKLQ